MNSFRQLLDPNQSSAKYSLMSTDEVVRLVSAEGFEFVIDKRAAMVSTTLRNMLSSTG